LNQQNTGTVDCVEIELSSQKEQLAVANLLDWKGAIGSSSYGGKLILCSFTDSGFM